MIDGPVYVTKKGRERLRDLLGERCRPTIEECRALLDATDALDDERTLNADVLRECKRLRTALEVLSRGYVDKPEEGEITYLPETEQALLFAREAMAPQLSPEAVAILKARKEGEPDAP